MSDHSNYNLSDSLSSYNEENEANIKSENNEDQITKKIDDNDKPNVQTTLNNTCQLSAKSSLKRKFESTIIGADCQDSVLNIIKMGNKNTMESTVLMTPELTQNESSNKLSKIPSGYIFGSFGKKKEKEPLSHQPIAKIPEKIDISKLAKLDLDSTPLFQNIGEKSKYEKVELIDGEQNDYIIVDISAKLFTFDAEGKNWKSNGIVNVHLNDSADANSTYSRLIVRLKDTLRLIINSKLSDKTSCKKMAPDQITLTVSDIESHLPKIICLKSSSADKLFQAIMERTAENKID